MRIFYYIFIFLFFLVGAADAQQRAQKDGSFVMRAIVVDGDTILVSNIPEIYVFPKENSQIHVITAVISGL
jgi:hypothetical protein